MTDILFCISFGAAGVACVLILDVLIGYRFWVHLCVVLAFMAIAIGIKS